MASSEIDGSATIVKQVMNEKWNVQSSKFTLVILYHKIPQLTPTQLKQNQ
jgi:hypothetical protein